VQALVITSRTALKLTRQDSGLLNVVARYQSASTAEGTSLTLLAAGKEEFLAAIVPPREDIGSTMAPLIINLHIES
jgi:hypothetical protein